jgi:L-lactate dehydrogenase (cytochrome)
LTLTEQALDLDQNSGWMARFPLGRDVMRALALGAKSCMIGRAYAYGLGAGGEAGVAKALDILGKEMLTTMGLCGVNTIAEIDDNVLAV